MDEATKQKMMRRHHRKPFNLRLWISSKWDEVQASLFFAPCVGVLLAIGVALGCLLLDKYFGNDSETLPTVLLTTVDSARSILGTIAGATISIAGTAFSISLLVFQMASSTFSPRITHTLFRDTFNRRVMAFNVSVFTYCLIVLRSVRSAEEDVVIPNISVALAVLLGIGSVLSIVAFIDHAAHSLDVSELLHRVCKDTIFIVERDLPLSKVKEGDGKDDKDGEPVSKHDRKFNHRHSHNGSTGGGEHTEPHMVRFRSSGWVQELHVAAWEALVPEGGYIKILTSPGRYVLRGSTLCAVHCGADTEMTDEEWYELDTLILDNVATGRTRTMRDDPAFGLRQVVDVALKALSPGVNDPTTAQDAIFHAADIVVEFLIRDPPPSVIKCKDHDGEVILNKQFTHDDIVKLAYDEARVCAAASPSVCLYLMESLRLVRESLSAFGFPDRAPEIERQVQLIEANCRKISTHISADLEHIARGRNDRFPSLFPTGETTYKDIVKNTSKSNQD